MKFILLTLTFLLLIAPLVKSETTFFDNPDDFFIMSGTSEAGSRSGSDSNIITNSTISKNPENVTYISSTGIIIILILCSLFIYLIYKEEGDK